MVADAAPRDPGTASEPPAGPVLGPGSTELLASGNGPQTVVPPPRRWVAAAAPLIGIYLCVRAGLLVADALSAHLGFGNALSGPLLAWDAHWYVQIASQGYPAHPAMASGQLTYNAANFLPFFPVLIRAVEGVGLSAVVSASLVSWDAGAAATLLVWRLGAEA
ncbi:MAG: hypothetical protein KGJ77_10910, partial [Acidobacteriota bacterium]|nr:hypothetical protein [Acidobacteriota bacterium]